MAVPNFILVLGTAASAAVLAACTHVAPPDAAVQLTVQPVIDQGSYRALDVELAFRGCDSGTTKLVLPDAWGGETQLYKALREVRADGATLHVGDTPAERRLTHAPGQRITVRYRVWDDVASAPDVPKQDGNNYRPVIKPSHFHVLGNAIVAQPSCTTQQAKARFALKGLPADHAFASDLQHEDMGRVLSFGDLVESVLVGGDFRVIDASGGARLAIRGQWAWSDEQWREQFVGVAQALRTYWRSAGEPYLVTVLALEPKSPGHISTGGTGRSDAFAFFATTSAQPERLVQTLAHEMTHTWVPRHIGRLAEQPEAADYWLSEGFTDWVAWRALVRAGVWTPADFARTFNEALKAYDLSPARDAPNATIEQAFWRDSHVQKLPYQRGMLLATHWDAAVQRATQNRKRLDDVLYDMQRRAAADAQLRAVDLLVQAMQSVAGVDISADLARYVERGETAPLARETFGACGALQTVDRPTFHRGFDIERTLANGGVITGLVAGGPAERAGLRDGMKLIARRAGEIGDATQEIAYEVADAAGQKRTLRWMPTGTGRVVFRQLQLALSAPQECQRQLGG